VLDEVHKGYDTIQNWVPDAIIDLKYATEDNFVGKVVYDQIYDRLRIGTLKKLVKAAQTLREKNFRLVIWDAYRPLAVQQLFWDLVQDETYVAHPSVGSKHNRGCALDVTLADMSGTYLEMPSQFDDFSSRASVLQTGLNPNVKERLDALQNAMLLAGFENYPKEWWHFTDSDWEDYTFKDGV